VSGELARVRWRAIAAYGEPGDLRDYSVIPPADYASRYRMRARARLEPGGRFLAESVTVTHRASAASLTFDRQSPVTWRTPADFAPDDLPRLWRDALYLVGLVDRNLAGPPRGTGKTWQDVQAKGDELRDPETGDGPTLDTVAEGLGVSPRYVSKLCQDHGGYKAVVPAKR
jgi:hypothetical protein